MTRQELLQHLRRQLLFLRNSARAYDQGAPEEAIRLAVVIRVLCHDTGASTSLLSLLGEKDTLEVVTTARALPPTIAAHPLPYGELLSGMVFGETIHHTPIPAGSPVLTFTDWWTQTVHIQANEPYSRKDVVLAAAHKDGGAHVDEPDSDLIALRTGFWMKVYVNADGQKVQQSIGDTHFRLLRRFADELLHSPALLALAH